MGACRTAALWRRGEREMKGIAGTWDFFFSPRSGACGGGKRLSSSTAGKPTKKQEEEDVGRGDQASIDDRKSEKKLHGDGGANHLGKVARRDRDLAGNPQQNIDPRVKVRPADLSQIFP